MTEQATPAATWDVTASVTVTSLSAADGARFALADVVNRIAAAGVATDTAVEMHRNDPANQPYGRTFAAEVADELDRREQGRAQQVDQIIAADIATENAAYDAANTPTQQAVGGLDNAASRQPIGWTVLMNHWTDEVPPALFRAKLGTRDWAHAEAARLNENPDAGESFRPVAVYLDAIVSAPAATEEQTSA